MGHWYSCVSESVSKETLPYDSILLYVSIWQWMYSMKPSTCYTCDSIMF